MEVSEDGLKPLKLACNEQLLTARPARELCSPQAIADALLSVRRARMREATHGPDCGRHFEALVDMLELKRQALSADTQDMQMARSKHMAEGTHGWVCHFRLASTQRTVDSTLCPPVPLCVLTAGRRFSLLRPNDAQKLNRMRRPPTSTRAAGSAVVSGAAGDVDAELEAENAALVQELVQRSGQRQHDITALHQQMAEIASQNQRLAHLLHDQSEVIDTLHADAEEIDDNVDAGNKELQQAVSRDSSNFRNLVVGLLLGASVCLLFLDYYA